GYPARERQEAGCSPARARPISTPATPRAVDQGMLPAGAGPDERETQATRTGPAREACSWTAPAWRPRAPLDPRAQGHGHARGPSRLVDAGQELLAELLVAQRHAAQRDLLALAHDHLGRELVDLDRLRAAGRAVVEARGQAHVKGAVPEHAGFDHQARPDFLPLDGLRPQVV